MGLADELLSNTGKTLFSILLPFENAYIWSWHKTESWWRTRLAIRMSNSYFEVIYGFKYGTVERTVIYEMK